MRFFIYALLVCVVLANTKSPFEVMGLPKTATDDQIKQRFRELTKKYHPDKNPDPKAKDMYSEITNAYQILSTPAERRKYEQTVENERFQNSFNGNPWNVYGGGYSTQVKQANHKKVWLESFQRKNNQSYQQFFANKKKTHSPSSSFSPFTWMKNKIAGIFSGGLTDILMYGAVIFIALKIFGSVVRVQNGQN